MTVQVRHATQVAQQNNPDRAVSATAWNEYHEVTGLLDIFPDIDTDASASANGTALQSAIDAANEAGGGVIRLGPGTFYTTPLQRKNNVTIQGSGKGVTILKLGDGENDNLIEDEGFAEFADDVRRSYSWHSTTASRNAQSYNTGTYVMVAATSTDFDNATWWVANSDTATTDGEWDSVPSVVGCVGGGLHGLTIDGNASGQSGNYLAAALYGIDTTIDEVSFENAATALHAEAPGGVFSTQVGRNLQWSMRGIECRKFTVCGFIDNATSDGVALDVMCYANDDVVPSVGLCHVKSKASGRKLNGFHVWGGADGTVGVIVDAAGVHMDQADAERPVQINQSRLRYSGQVYRINNAAADAGSAFIIATGLNALVIEANVSHFKYAYKQVDTPGAGNSISITHYSEASGAARLDPAGTTTDSAQSQYEYRANFSGAVRLGIFGVAGTLRATVVRSQPQSIAYASSITADIRDGDVVIVGELTSGITINAPTNVFPGHQITFMFTQDSTGGHGLTWDSVFVGGPTASGAAGTRRACWFKYDGTKFVLIGDTGSWV